MPKKMGAKKSKKTTKVIPDGMSEWAVAHEMNKLPKIYDLPKKWIDMANNMATPTTAPIFEICAKDLMRILWDE